MQKKNRESIYHDGIENVENGTLYYTDSLIAKVKEKFEIELPKSVKFENIDNVANFIITNIIQKYQTMNK